MSQQLITSNEISPNTSISASQIASVSNTAITGLINSNQISSVTTTQLTGQVSVVQLDTGSATGNGSIIVPIGTTGQRPTATAGAIRYNTTLSTLESANGVSWANVGSGSASSSSSAANLTSLTGNVFISAAGGIVDSSNAVGGLVLPTGTTAQRPASAANGTIRWNSSNTWLEVYVAGNTGWYTLASTSYLIEVLAVGGGGSGGGYNAGGGGGAGGVLSVSTSTSPGLSYGVVIGGGGAGIAYPSQGNSGTNSTFGSLVTAYGGGYGQTQSTGSKGGDGGSGGGAGGGGGVPAYSGGTAGSGTTGQGNPGGLGYFSSGADGAGGGGGAGAPGGNGSSNNGGAGGAGTNSFSAWTTATGTGVSNYLGGGGGGESYNGSSAPGGSGGGGNGSIGAPPGTGGSGTTNTGGGGGGAFNSGSGGSGLVIVRYLGSQRGFGGTINSLGGYTYHKFTASGTYIA